MASPTPLDTVDARMGRLVLDDENNNMKASSPASGPASRHRPSNLNPLPSSPLPTTPTADDGDPLHHRLHIFQPRPSAPRRSTDPPAVFLNSENLFTFSHKRNRSPYTRSSASSSSHLRTRSSTSALTAPGMVRAHSLPSVTTIIGTHSNSAPNSPYSPRVRSPFRPPPEESFPPPSGPSLFDVDPILEDQELDLTPRQPSHDTNMSRPVSAFSSSPFHSTFPRSASSSSRRRPVSPMGSRSFSPSFSSPRVLPPTTLSASSSPALGPSRYNEPFPLAGNGSVYSLPSLGYGSSSIPSTPTSTRSRSPSIASLETIPDSPDAEEVAQEEDRLDRLKVEAEAAEAEERGEVARWTATHGRRGTVAGDEGRGRPLGWGSSIREKRKRWSVCGAERRGDLEMETIWED